MTSDNGKNNSEHESREDVYRKQQEELRRKQREQRFDLIESLRQRNEMEAGFMQQSLGIWGQYFNRLNTMNKSRQKAMNKFVYLLFLGGIVGIIIMALPLISRVQSYTARYLLLFIIAGYAVFFILIRSLMRM